MSESLSRRELMTKALPGVTIAGAAGLGMLSAFVSGEALAQPAPGGNQGGVPGMPPGGGPDGPRDPYTAAMIGAYADGEYSLPKLGYDYNALEPHIDAQTMELHHAKHHQSYVDGLNKAMKGLAELRAGAEIDPLRLSALQRELAFHTGGHVLHTIFWATMGPGAPPAPEGDLAEAINKDFGSLDGLKTYYSAVAAGVKGSGWAVLTYLPLGDRLEVVMVNEHNLNLLAGGQPLLPIDVWEHAYYLKHQNKRAEYIKSWWNVVNWKAVEVAFMRARRRRRGNWPGGPGGGERPPQGNPPN